MNEDKLKQLIQEHISDFDVDPSVNHEQKFLSKLALRFKKAVISLVPYIKKLIIITLIVWAISIILWWIFDLPTLWQIFKIVFNAIFK